jgi:hypothetical protein
MANIRAFVIAGLATFVSGTAIAISSQDIPAEVGACKAVVDDTERLKCFDGMFVKASESPQSADKSQTTNPPAKKPAIWSIDEKQSPDGNPEIIALNFLGDDAVLILRCKNQITEAAFSTKAN